MSARSTARGTALAATLLLAGCADDVMLLPGIKQPDNRPAPAATAGTLPAPTAALPAPQPGGGIDRSLRIVTAGDQVPEIWLALEPGVPLGLVFAADAAGDGPQNDPAVRLRPDRGLCNPEELPSYRFEGPPVFDRRVAARGVGPAELPEYMAVSVSRAMIEAGLAVDPIQTQPQNVCTLKLWQNLVFGQGQAAAAAGQ